MADSPLLSKSKTFELEVIKVCNEIKSTKRESVLTNQLIRSGTMDEVRGDTSLEDVFLELEETGDAEC